MRKLVMISKKLLLSGCILLFAVSCKYDKPAASSFYPMFVDDNSNGINDYIEKDTHQTGYQLTSQTTAIDGQNRTLESTMGHQFVDDNGNGICDSAEDGSLTWHGPGFIDEDEDGVCDYWDENASRFNRHRGTYYQDLDNNDVNDYFEADTHASVGHEFVDENGDGICDQAQNGSQTRHGPEFTDSDHDGIHDHWLNGGRGHRPHS